MPSKPYERLATRKEAYIANPANTRDADVGAKPGKKKRKKK